MRWAVAIRPSGVWLGLMLCLWASPLQAQLLKDELPENVRGVDVEDRVGQFIPLDLLFTDEQGNRVGLGKYFMQDKPVVLTLNYSDCPGLCIAQLDNLTKTLREIDGGGIGKRFDIVTVSIDPREKPEQAARTKAKYTGMLRGTNAEEGWHFLTGDAKAIAKLADAVGFRYVYDRANERYNHPAATYFVSSDGRICRYLLSLGVEPEQFKLAVNEADEGRLAPSLVDAFVQLCYYYDPDANRYTASARRIMAFGGAAFVIMLAGASAPFWGGRKRRHAAEAAGAANVPSQENEPPEASA